MIPRGLQVVLLGVLAASLSGCRHTSVLDSVPEVVDPQATFSYATVFEASGEGAQICSSLGDSQLRRLHNWLAAESLDLRAASARVLSAEARAREAGSALKPRVSFTSQASQSGTTRSSQTHAESYQPSLAASYEVDLFGRLRNGREAARLDAVATAEDLRSLSISIASSLTEIWIGILAEQELLSLLERQQRASSDFLSLTSLRFGQGFGRAQDIGRQKEQLLSLEGEIERSLGRLEELEIQLAALLGSTHRVEVEGSTTLSSLLVQIGLPDLGLPADLLERRPDVRALRLRLEAADKRLEAVVKSWLPSLSLTGSVFDLQSKIELLFKDLLAQVAATVSESVYEGGARKARIDQARANAEDTLYRYGQALVDAVAEVNTALVRHRTQAEVLRNLEERLSEARRVLDLTREGYTQGATDYLNVITALLSEQSLEQQLVGARRQQLSNRVQLCRALGHAPGSEPFELQRAWATPSAVASPTATDVAGGQP